MNEWKRIFSNRKYRIAIFCIPVLCLLLFFYQKCDGNFGALTKDAQEYRQLLTAYSGKTPEEITLELSNQWLLTQNQQQLLAQSEHLRDYPGYLERVQKQAADLQASSLFGGSRNTFVYRNIVKTAEDFSGCSALGICLGNDRAVRDWLAFSPADWAYLAAVLLLVMSFVEERKKGLAAIIRSCPAGREKLQFSRLLVLLCYCAGMTLLIYYLPLGLSLLIDGGWKDLSRPVQSLMEFQKSTMPLTISGFLLQFFLVKIACGFLLGVLIWFLLSFVEHVQLCWLVTMAVLAGEYLLYTFIPPQSVFSVLRSINVFSYVFTTRMYTQYQNINFFSFPVRLHTLLMGLLVVLSAFLSLTTLWVLSRRYPFGNRDLLGRWILRWNRAGDALRRHLNLFGMEWYKLLFLSAGGLFLLLGLLLTRNIRCNSGAYDRIDDAVYRQYIAEIQGPVSADTYAYLANARQSLENAPMGTPEFDVALDRLEQALSQLDDGDWLVDETHFMNIYGSKAWRLQRKNGLLSMIFLAACLSPLFACEQSGDLRKILRSTPGGRKKLFLVKYAVALSVTVLVWLLVFGQEWRAASNLLGKLTLSAPCGSIGILKGFPFTVGNFLILLYLGKGLALLIFMHLCLFLGERSKSFEQAFLSESVVLLLPAAAYRFGADAFRFITPLSLLADGRALFSGGGLMLLIVWMLLSLLALFGAGQHWCCTK